ncbi:hypothetical protein [Mucilaginibacter ginsenosidivorax]|uniref:Signal peptidase n=1 Tax=Mucilaginibacter ginsenosidivorax TaxID=862126 RepID=A0A5B8VVS5_9SPHI|nr:hypothetical protein [Mucilaginibacter ginsenosidivorax]QEC75353.1 hypothetical protein FSB76_05125 [Mucilaginibacter ginsenosidivorax]
MKICKSGLKYVYSLLATFLFITAPVIGHAQGELPCNDADPFNSACPLDTWIMALVIIAGVYAAVYLHRKQKAFQS